MYSDEHFSDKDDFGSETFGAETEGNERLEMWENWFKQGADNKMEDGDVWDIIFHQSGNECLSDCEEYEDSKCWGCQTKELKETIGFDAEEDEGYCAVCGDYDIIFAHTPQFGKMCEICYEEKDEEGELKTIYGAESPARMSQEELLDFFNSLKPKEEILIWYNSGIRRGDDWTPMTVGRRSESKKYNLKKISLTGKQGGKFTLYNRQGKISLAMGDMATVLISAKKNGSFGAETFGSERQELCIWGCGSKVYKKGEPCYSCKYGAETFGAGYKNCEICENNLHTDEFSYSEDKEQTLTPKGVVCNYCFGDILSDDFDDDERRNWAFSYLKSMGFGAESFEAKGIDTLAKPFEEIGIPKTYARLGVITAGITALAFGVMKLKDR